MFLVKIGTEQRDHQKGDVILGVHNQRENKDILNSVLDMWLLAWFFSVHNTQESLV